MTLYDLVREGTEKRIDFLFNKNVKKKMRIGIIM